MSFGDYIGVGEDSLVLPPWMPEMLDKMVDVITHCGSYPVEVVGVEVHRRGAITIHFKESEE